MATSELLLPVASSAAIALLLGMAALYAWRRRGWPLLAHGLALLGLLKLLTPPLVGPRWELGANHSAVTTLGESELLALLTQAGSSASAAAGPAGPSSWLDFVPSWSEALLGIWALGSLVTGLLAWHRHRRMTRLLDRLEPAPVAVTEQTARLVERLGLRRAPRVGVTQASLAPFLYAMGPRPTIVLPAELLEDPRALRTTLAHELGHLAGRDHLVRWLELVVSVLHWWNPAAHLLRATLREVEEVRCDLRAVAALETSPKRYGRELLATAERFEAADLPLGAHALGGGHPLARRLTVLATRGAGARGRLEGAARLAVVLVLGAALPLGAREAEDESRASKANAVTLGGLRSDRSADVDFDELAVTVELAGERAVTEAEAALEQALQAELELEELEGLRDELRATLEEVRRMHEQHAQADHTGAFVNGLRAVRMLRGRPLEVAIRGDQGERDDGFEVLVTGRAAADGAVSDPGHLLFARRGEAAVVLEPERLRAMVGRGQQGLPSAGWLTARDGQKVELARVKLGTVPLEHLKHVEEGLEKLELGSLELGSLELGELLGAGLQDAGANGARLPGTVRIEIDAEFDSDSADAGRLPE